MPRVNTNNRRRNHRRHNNTFCAFCKGLGKNPFGHTIKNCEELKQISCKNCGKNGHTFKYCPFIEKCKFCKRVGHNEKTCYYNPQNNIQQCSGCKKYGHSYEECYYVSREDKNKFLQEKEERKKKEEEQKKLQQQKISEFDKKGFSYDENYLRFCKNTLQSDPDFIPWVIYSDSPVNGDLGLSKKENQEYKKIMDEIKRLE